MVLDALQEWAQKDFDPRLISTINFYLAKQGLLHPEKVLGDLKSPDIQLQGAAIIALKKSLAYLPPTTAAYNRTLAAQYLKLLLDSDQEAELCAAVPAKKRKRAERGVSAGSVCDECVAVATDEEQNEPDGTPQPAPFRFLAGTAALCMGLQILGIEGDSHDIDILITFLKHPSLTVARTAAQSIVQTGLLDSIRQAPLIINQLDQTSDNELRLACLKALEKVDDSSLVDDIINKSLHFRPNERRLTEEIIYKMGLRTVPALLSITKDTHVPDRCRLLAGQILGRLALPQLRANLSVIIGQEIERAYLYFYHYHTIQTRNPDVDLSMLRDVLITGYHSVLDFIIQILAVAGEVEDEELLSRSLRSRNPKVRSQAVEALEKTCEPPIFRLLQPLVDDIPYEEKIRAYVKRGDEPWSLNTLLDKMSESSAQIDQIIAAAMKYHLDLPNWRDSLRQQMSRQDEIFHHFAYELLES